MQLKTRLKKLGDHYKVSQGTMGLADWSKAIKKAAGREYVSVEVLYEEVFGPKKEADVEVIPPSKAVTVTDKQIEVAAPTMNFNLVPAKIDVSPSHLSAVYTLVQVGKSAFVFVSGAMAGFLFALALKGGI